MKARDLMVPVNAFLMPGDSVEEFFTNIRVVRSWEKTCGIRSLPVLDAEGKLVGVLSMHDILKAVYPSYLYETDLSLFTWDGMLESLAPKILGKKVAHLMTKGVITVRDDHPLMECVDHMLKHRISTLPVLDHDGKLKGMIYESEVFFAVADALFGGKE